MPRPLARFLKVEQLEDRAVPATFNGTALDDRFSLNGFGPNSVLVTRYNASNVLQGQAVVTNDGITINGLGGDDQINIDGPLALAFGFDGGSGTDTIAQFNSSKLSIQDFGATGYYGLSGGAGVYFNDTNVEQVLFYGTAADDALNIESGPSYTGLYFSGGAGSDTVQFHNTNSTTLDQVNASTTQVSRPGQANVFLNDDDIEQIVLNGTAGADLFTINTPPPQRVGIAIAAGGGHDVTSVSALVATVTDYGGYGQVATGAGAIYFGDGELEQLNLPGTAGNDSSTVNALTATIVVVSGGAGSDTLTLPNQTNVGLQDYGTYSVATPAGAAPVFLSDTDLESIYLLGTAAVDTFNIVALPNYASVAVQAGAGVDTMNLRGQNYVEVTGFSGYGLLAPSSGGGFYFSDEVDDLNIFGTAGDDTFRVGFRPLNTRLSFDGLSGMQDQLNLFFIPGAVVSGQGAYSVVTPNGGAPISMINLATLYILGTDANNTFDMAAGLSQTFLFLDCGSGNDTVLGSPRGDLINGRGGDDTISGNGGDDKIYGFAGNDFLSGGDGNDLIYGMDGDNTLRGDDGDDQLYGSIGNDFLDGGRNNDSLFGEAGNDVLQGGEGNDQLFGGDGNNDLTGYLPGSTTPNGSVDRDVFLAWHRTGFTDTLNDLAPEDARITFRDTTSTSSIGFAGLALPVQFAAASWTQDEIALVQPAFGILLEAVNNTKLLKLADGGELTYFRYGTQINYTELPPIASVNFSDGRLGLMGALFSASSAQIELGALHSLAFNWSEPSQNSFNATAFRNLSGWIQSGTNPGANYSASTLSDDDWWYLTASQFASEFGKFRPDTDYATTWETYFYELAYGIGSSSYNRVAAKLQNIADFVAWIRTP